MNLDPNIMFNIAGRIDAYNDLVDENYRNAIKETDRIIAKRFMYDEEEDPYTDYEFEIMVDIAHKIQTIIWVLATVGNLAYEDINKPETQHSRWFAITHIMLLPELMMSVGALTGYAVAMPNTLNRLSRYDKEFTLSRMCHPIFSHLGFMDSFSKFKDRKNEPDDDKMEKIFTRPLIIDAVELSTNLLLICRDLDKDIDVINNIDLDAEICEDDYKVEYTNEQTIDTEWIDTNIEVFDMMMIPTLNDLINHCDKMDLNGKLNVLNLLNGLILDLSTYTRDIVSNGIEYDCDIKLNPLLNKVAEMRNHLGIKVDDGGNYIGEDTNKLI
jgi:hypothetical protein